MTENSKWEISRKMDDYKIGLVAIECDDKAVAKVWGDDNAQLIVDSVNKVKRYEEALEFYANYLNHTEPKHKATMITPVCGDKGQIARNALKQEDE